MREEGFALAFLGVWIALGIVIVALAVYTAMRICKKAGYSEWLGLLTLVPLGELILRLYLAFSDWPIERELREAKSSRSA